MTFTLQKRFSRILQAFIRNRKYFLPVLLTITNSIITYFALTTKMIDGFLGDKYGYTVLFGLNIFFIFVLSYLIINHIYTLRKKAKEEKSGSRFHYRIVILFTLAALLPTLMVAGFSAITFKKAADGWFSQGVETAIYNAKSVAEAYLNEHHHNIRADSFATAADLKPILESDVSSLKDLFKQMQVQLLLRDLGQVIVYNENGDLIGAVHAPYHYNADKKTPNLYLADMLKSKQSPPFQDVDKTGRYVFALIPIYTQKGEYFLRIDRRINPQATIFQKKTDRAVSSYEFLKGRKHIAEIGFALIYISFGLAAVTFMVHTGLYFASQMTAPLEYLTNTVEKIEQGDSSASMPEPLVIQDEIDKLIVAFNRMTKTLSKQKQELIESNTYLSARKKIIETVLSGVSSGVLGISQNGEIKLFNKRVQEIFHIYTPLINLASISNELLEWCMEQSETHKIYERDYQYTTIQGDTKSLHIKLWRDDILLSEERPIHIVLTIDDVTELVKAQSMSAWRDVARRIAHEIKNPLTPISLAAQRIERKWGRDISKDKEIFEGCIATILRQVEHIRETTDSFAHFAKMPTPQKQDFSLNNLLKEVMFLEKMRMSNIDYYLNLPDEKIIFNGDERLISQALINILKNASQSIAEKNTADKGEISITLTQENNNIIISVTDNGIGLPANIPSYKLFEPYITQSEEGTGLGLAITAKIITDHEGKITISNNDDNNGAIVKIVFGL